MDDLFVVTYQAFDGKMEIFGTFNSFEDAFKWMKADFERCIMQLEIQKIKRNSTVSEDTMTIDEYGEWKVYKLEKASPIF